MLLMFLVSSLRSFIWFFVRGALWVIVYNKYTFSKGLIYRRHDHLCMRPILILDMLESRENGNGLRGISHLLEVV